MRSKQLVADWSQAASRKSWEWELQSPAGKIKGPDELGQGTVNTGTTRELAGGPSPNFSTPTWPSTPRNPTFLLAAVCGGGTGRPPFPTIRVCLHRRETEHTLTTSGGTGWHTEHSEAAGLCASTHVHPLSSKH